MILTNPTQEFYSIGLNVASNQMFSTDFSFGDETEVNGACSIVFQGETLILGGRKEYNQVSKFSKLIDHYYIIFIFCIIFYFCIKMSKIDLCGLERMNTDLPFESNLHAKIYCGIFNFKGNIGEVALICRHQECYM